MKGKKRTSRTAAPRAADQILDDGEVSLLDVVDNVLSRGVVLNGELLLGVADVDLVYLRLSAVLCAADRIAPALALDR